MSKETTVMRKEEKAAFDVLAKAADVHNCWAILDEAVTSGEDDQFTKEYIEGEREMLEGSILEAASALRTLGKSCGIDAKTGNDSYAYMRKVREEHLTELERAAEFDRGYRAGRRSMDAERQAVALKLRGLSFDGGSHENLGKIAYAIYPCATGWTPESCDGLRDQLVRLLGGVNERETTLTTCDALDNERRKAVRELRKMTIDSHYYDNYQRIALAIGATYDGKRFASECVRDRLIHLLGGDVCEGGNHGDCAERRRAGAAGGDTDMDEHAKMRAVSDGIADMLSRQGKVKFPPNEDGSIEGLKTVEETAALIDDVKRRANQSHESSLTRQENEIGITDELREFKGRINAGLAPEMVLALRAEINCIADHIEEQFDRIRQKQEAVLQETIEQLRRQMDQQRAMLTQQRDEARAKVIALCNECDKLKRAADSDADHIENLSGAYNDMERERDNLLDQLRDAVVDFKNASYGWDYAAVVSENITIETERNILAKERDTLQKWLDDMREQREHWADEATKMYRLFFPHDEYCVPDNPSEMVIPKINEMQKKLDELEKFDHDISLAAFGDDNEELRKLLSRASKLLANAEQDRDMNYAYWMDCKEKVVQANVTIDELQAKLDGIAGLLDG